MDLKTGFDGICEHINELSGAMKIGEFTDYLFLSNKSDPWS
jgi:hypothetical protein